MLVIDCYVLTSIHRLYFRQKVSVQHFVALDPKDGSVIWQSEPHDISYASPIVINVDGQDQIVFFSSTEVIGLDAGNGHTLWRYPCKNRFKNNATDPIWAGDNLLWVATQTDGGTRVLRLAQRNGKTDVKEVWFNGKVKLFHWNAIRIGDYVYASGLDDDAIVAFHRDASTGLLTALETHDNGVDGITGLDIPAALVQASQRDILYAVGLGANAIVVFTPEPDVVAGIVALWLGLALVIGIRGGAK